MTGCPVSPPELPAGRLMGSLAAMRNDPLSTYAAAANHGDVVAIRVGPAMLGLRPHVVAHPDGVQHVLGRAAATYRKEDPTFDEIRRWFGDGLALIHDEPWKIRRRTVQPLLTARHVAAYDHQMAATTDELVQRWEGHARTGEPVDLAADLKTFALDVLNRVMMGGDAEAAASTISPNCAILSQHVLRRLSSVVPFGSHLPSPSNIRARTARRQLFAAAGAIVEKRTESGAASDPPDLLDRLLVATDPETGASMSRTDIVDDLIILLLAGHETSSTMMMTALHLLAKHPEIQDEVHAEVDTVLGGRACTAADLDDLGAIDRVLRESMRLYPPFWGVTRRSIDDDEIGGYRIEAGQMVAVSQWVTHRDPRWWECPAQFDPARWNGRAAERHRYAWFPFGGGPRGCPGERFAMQEGLIALAGVLQRFRLTPVTDELKVRAGVSLLPTEPVYVRLQLRS